jgi:hypothetical protein
MLVGEQDTVALTVTAVAPEPPALLLMSPEYVAVIEGEPAEVSEYVTEQLPELNVQGDPVNEPVESEVVKETVPEGLYPDDSVAVHVVDDPTVNDGHDTEMVGVALTTVTVVVPVPALL